MKTKRSHLIIALAFFALINFVSARENVGSIGITPTAGQLKSVQSGCVNATQQIDLDINNVRAKILNGGDMWWDIFGSQAAAYQVPKTPSGEVGPSSQFASSVWVGGYDAGGQLKVAGQTYRQSGNDYWPGPLTSTATIDAATCIAWDKFWKINRADVAAHYNWVIAGSPGTSPVVSNPSLPDAMDNINNWPAYGPEGQPLAPYWDVNSDGFYNPTDGDVPDFDITGKRSCAAKLYGDQCVFWVFNDKGNTHTESGCAAIGLEIQAQAFGFATNDELNNATFLKYKIINKSSFRLDSTFFGVWDDADLGWYLDDYVGCDVSLGLGILYNATAVDGSGQPTAYGANPPAIGIDFFEGPFATADGIDNPYDIANPAVPPSFLNYGNITIDDERLGLSKFVYFKNDASNQGNPQPGDDIYQYLTGTWRNGVPITYGETGTTGSIPCDYMFPGSSDQTFNWGTDGTVVAPWDAAGNLATNLDVRFVESSGPFVLQPGAVNTITVGVPWARATQGGNLASVALLKGADAKAQLLFNNCFATLNGPTAPSLKVTELNQEIILTWTNPSSSNNANENYSEDYDLAAGDDIPYTFQGYRVYQLIDGNVSPADLHNVSKAREIFQCDKQDAIKQIINFTFDPNLQALVPTEMVNGENKGIVHSISVTKDKFNSDLPLINHKTYYYAIIAYGHSPSLVIPVFSTLDSKPYIEGRLNADFPAFTPRKAIPHQLNGNDQYSIWGSGPKITRIEGRGNGGNVLDLTSSSVGTILASNFDSHPTYENGAGPINVKVIDPLNVPVGNSFRLIMNAKYPVIGANAFIPQDSSRWDLINLTTGDTIHSERTIKLPNEQIINGQAGATESAVVPKWGIAINVIFAFDPGNASAIKNSCLADASNVVFADPAKQWLSALPDAEGSTNENWIRSGTTNLVASDPDFVYNDILGLDDGQSFEKMIAGTWAPYVLCASSPRSIPLPNPILSIGGPAWDVPAVSPTALQLAQLKATASVDVVITSDQSKWTRCPVLELQEEPALAIGGAKKLNLRKSRSVDKNGNSFIGPDNNDFATGMGWFPGYAINLETGERLNMAFGEDSFLANDNGADMKWNPTSNTISYPSRDPLFGGKHYIYVFGHNGDAKYTYTEPVLPNSLSDIPTYDKGKVLHDLLTASAVASDAAPTILTAGESYKKEAFADAMWVNIPLLVQGHSILETDVKIRLRVTKSYQLFGTGSSVNDSLHNLGQKYYGLTIGETYYVKNGPVNDGTLHLTGSVFTAARTSYTSTITSPIVLNTQYKAAPTYEFNTSEIETRKNDEAANKSELDLINIVPNPYYAYSGYEQDAGDNIVKITNLPEKCTISIYTLSGSLIRTLTKSGPDASMEWDLKNKARIPVASGMYLIYIDVPGVGSKTLKWLGIMRPFDLEAY